MEYLLFLPCSSLFCFSPYILFCFLIIGYIQCEPPNNRLHKFVGTLTWNKDKEHTDQSPSQDRLDPSPEPELDVAQHQSSEHVYPINNDNIVLRVSSECVYITCTYMYMYNIYVSTRLLQLPISTHVYVYVH